MFVRIKWAMLKSVTLGPKCSDLRGLRWQLMWFVSYIFTACHPIPFHLADTSTEIPTRALKSFFKKKLKKPNQKAPCSFFPCRSPVSSEDQGKIPFCKFLH